MNLTLSLETIELIELTETNDLLCFEFRRISAPNRRLILVSSENVLTKAMFGFNCIHLFQLQHYDNEQIFPRPLHDGQILLRQRIMVVQRSMGNRGFKRN